MQNYKTDLLAACVFRSARAARAPRTVASPGRENGSHTNAVDGDNTTTDSTEPKDQKLTD